MKKPMTFAIGLAFLLVLSGCRQRLDRTVISDVPVTVGPVWIDIPLHSLIQAKWREQSIELTLSTSYEMNTQPWGLKVNHGPIFAPQVELITDSGTNYVFESFAFANSDLRFDTNRVPQGTRFVNLRVRSPQPIVLSRIVWITYMPEDTKGGTP
jgi:hypothetical protein